MTRTTWLFAGIFLSALFVQGCAPVVVGGAAATGVAVVHDRRSAGTVIDDQTIEINALARLLRDEQLRNHTHINATSYNGMLVLTGEAPTEDLRQYAVSKMASIPNVKRVQNEIILAAPSSLMSRGSDSLILSKAKVALFDVKSPGFDPTRVNIIAENGVVYLLGLLRRQEADSVVEVVRRVGGVQRVVKLFEYID